MDAVIGLIYLGSVIFVFVDAMKIKTKGLMPGFFDFGPFGWAFLTLIMWVVFFPFYLIRRGKYSELANKRDSDSSANEANNKQVKTVGFAAIGLVFLLALLSETPDEVNIEESSIASESISEKNVEPEPQSTGISKAEWDSFLYEAKNGACRAEGIMNDKWKETYNSAPSSISGQYLTQYTRAAEKLVRCVERTYQVESPY